MDNSLNFTQKSLLTRLAGYSTLAVAGLAGEPAVAATVTSGTGFAPVTIAPTQVAAIGFGGGVGSPFQFAEAVISSSMQAVIQRGPQAGITQSIVAAIGINDPRRLGAGYLISAGLNWYGNAVGTANDIAGNSAGQWNSPTTAEVVRGFLGIRFISPALSPGLHYGFFDVSYDNNPSSSNGKLTIWAWAFETDPDTSITTFS